jgi:hypothetical protein
MDIGQCLKFNGIIVEVIDIEYYHNSDLEIRHITVKEVNIY